MSKATRSQANPAHTESLTRWITERVHAYQHKLAELEAVNKALQAEAQSVNGGLVALLQMAQENGIVIPAEPAEAPVLRIIETAKEDGRE